MRKTIFGTRFFVALAASLLAGLAAAYNPIAHLKHDAHHEARALAMVAKYAAHEIQIDM